MRRKRFRKAGGAASRKVIRKENAVLRVLVKSAGDRRGILEFGRLRLPCALGKSGITSRKREGDGATPRGRWALRGILYRPDRGLRPRSGLLARAIRASDGWCDAPEDRNYNRPVSLPYPASSERLCRDDRLYNLIVPLGYNDGPRARYRGSAIFMHIAREGFSPTEGCVALRPEDMRKLLMRLPRKAEIDIGATPRPGPYRMRRGFR